MEIRSFRASDEPEVLELWRACDLLRTWNDPRKDIARKRAVQAELFLIGSVDERVVATVMAGYDGHRGWVNYLAVHPQSRRAGLGRRLMGEVEHRLHALGCPKLNLQVRDTNAPVLKFYERLGYTQDRVVSFGKRLEQDD